MRQRKDISLLQPSDGSGIDSAFPATINRPQAGSSALITLASDAFKQTGIIARSTGQPQDSQNNIKAVTSALASPLMPTILTSDIPTNIQQTIATPLGNNGWAGEFSQKIIWMSTQQNQIAELHLNPPDLGPLKVVLEISENQLTAQFTSPHSGVRDAVENALPKLRDILADSGIKLGNTTVSDQPSRDRSAEGFMNQGYGSAAQRETSYKATESNGISPTTAQGIPMRRHNGLLDTFA
jgi:flagellar hook-length control protein FliK